MGIKIKERFVKDSNNVISLTLTEDGTAITGAWTDLDIDIVNPYTGLNALNINRASDGNGVALNVSTGVLTIDPGLLTETLTPLVDGVEYRVYITVKTSGNLQGTIFGADDSGNFLFFAISDPT